jgi:hypothetical protein
LVLLSGLLVSLLLGLAGYPWRRVLASSLALLLALIVERMVAGALAWRRFGTLTGIYFAPFHLLRDVAWAAAIVVWTTKRLSGRAFTPADSMMPKGE